MLLEDLKWICDGDSHVPGGQIFSLNFVMTVLERKGMGGTKVLGIPTTGFVLLMPGKSGNYFGWIPQTEI